MTNLRRNISAPLATLLNTTLALMVADLYTITLSGGAVLRWTNLDVSVTIGGNTYSSLGPGIKRKSVKQTAGTQVDPLTVEFMGGASTLVNGVPIIAFIAGGGFDNAQLQLDRAFAPIGGAWVGSINVFFGRIAEIQIQRLKATITVRDPRELLNVNLPRRVYQPGCLNTLYDSWCTLAKATYQVSGAATSATDAQLLTFSTNLPEADHYFDLGAVTFTGGANSGLRFSIASYVGGAVTLVRSAASAVAPGDTFTILPGCDKSLNTCRTKYGNVVHFRGFPAIPVPEMAV